MEDMIAHFWDMREAIKEHAIIASGGFVDPWVPGPTRTAQMAAEFTAADENGAGIRSRSCRSAAGKFQLFLDEMGILKTPRIQGGFGGASAVVNINTGHSTGGDRRCNCFLSFSVSGHSN